MAASLRFIHKRSFNRAWECGTHPWIGIIAQQTEMGMPLKKEIYEKLIENCREISLLSSIDSLLYWDERTQMPVKGSAHRAEQAAYMAGLIHGKWTDPAVGELLGELESAGTGENGLSVEDVNVREMRRDYDLKRKLPPSLVEEISRTSVLAQETWQQAREKKDFTIFQPLLSRMIDLKRNEAECYGYEHEVYDALFDQYEPGADTRETAGVLASLRDELVPILAGIKESPKKPDTGFLRANFPKEAQESFVRKVAAGIGYDFDCGKLTDTVHPFCIELGPSDVRITTRYQPDFLNSALFGVIHEAGHGIYEQNLPREHWGTPAGQAVSLGIHESQSRLWENIVGRSHAFWEYWYPVAQDHFSALKDVTLDDFHFAINEAKPSFIRVEADELTYNLHILLRFEIEREIIAGNLPVADIPAEWNDRFKAYFGIEVPDDSQGCLQDIHWSAGLFGYFPTYSLGNLNAAQLFAKAKEDLGDTDGMFRRGEFTPLREWLTENVHKHGRTYSSAQLIEKVSGKPLDASLLTGYLKEKSGGLYGIEL